MLYFLAKQEDIKNFFTEKCKNCMTGESPMLTRESNVEHVDSMASRGSSRRQSSRSFGIGPTLKSNVRNSASSLTHSGWETVAMHSKSHQANSQFASLISCNVCPYISLSVLGNLFRAYWTHPGRHLLRKSSWQYTHLNLSKRYG